MYTHNSLTLFHIPYTVYIGILSIIFNLTIMKQSKKNLSENFYISFLYLYLNLDGKFE